MQNPAFEGDAGILPAIAQAGSPCHHGVLQEPPAHTAVRMVRKGPKGRQDKAQGASPGTVMEKEFRPEADRKLCNGRLCQARTSVAPSGLSERVNHQPQAWRPGLCPAAPSGLLNTENTGV